MAKSKASRRDLVALLGPDKQGAYSWLAGGIYWDWLAGQLFRLTPKGRVPEMEIRNRDQAIQWTLGYAAGYAAGKEGASLLEIDGE